jgi:protein-tyrosine-phosphatase
MAKAIFEQILRQRGPDGEIFVDSAGIAVQPGDDSANKKARKAIELLYGADLLAHHKPKSINSVALSDFDLFLTMKEGHKLGLPEKKTYTLKEYAGLSGNVTDPIGGDLDTYIRCRDEIKDCLDRIVEKMLGTRH